MGIGLLVVSFSAIGRANLSAQEGRAIGAAANIVVRNYMDIGITRILSTCYSMVNFFLHPFRLVGRWVMSVYGAGVYTLKTILIMPFSVYRGFLIVVDSIHSKIAFTCMTTWNDLVFFASLPVLAYQELVLKTRTIAIIWENAINQKIKSMITIFATKVAVVNDFLNDFALRVSYFTSPINLCVVKLYNMIYCPLHYSGCLSNFRAFFSYCLSAYYK